ncbi:MAG: ABC transporter permease, partial [Myxococcales bacterium]|nr:ABC transporter permease [Myxococcales bacterium]
MRAYESLVGWRYLLRRRRQLLVLGVGLALLGAGIGLVAWGVQIQQDAGGAISVFGNRAGAAQTLMGVGGGLAVLGGCVGLFGLLNAFLTVFAAFSAFMVTIGVAEVILVLAVMNGFQGDLRGKIIDTYAHVVIESATQGGQLSDYRALAETARTIPEVTGATPVLTTEVMFSSRTNLAAVVLMGVDIETVGQANKLPKFMKKGALTDLTDPEGVEARAWRTKVDRPEGAPDTEGEPEPEAPAPAGDLGDMAFPTPAAGRPKPLPTLLLGDELRKSLGMWPGERVNVISPFGELGPQGPVPRSRPFRVAGWFASGMLEFDSKLAYADLSAVQQFMGLDDVASAVQIRTTSLEAARGVRDALQAKLGPAVKVADWQQRNRNLFSALKLEKIAMFLVLTINILLAAFSITSTLVMTIIERR